MLDFVKKMFGMGNDAQLKPIIRQAEEIEKLEPQFEKTKKELGDMARCDEDVLSYIAFPQLAEPFFEKRKEQEENRAVYTIEEIS